MEKFSSQSSFLHNVQKLASRISSSESSSDDDSLKKYIPMKKSGKKLNRIMELSSSDDGARSSDGVRSPPNALESNTKTALNNELSERSGQSVKPKDGSSTVRVSVPATSSQSTCGGMKDCENRFSKTQLQVIREIVREEVTSAKLSILHDVAEKVNELKIIILQINIPNVPRASTAELSKKFGIKLPMKSLEDFLSMEGQLMEKQLQDALLALYANRIFNTANPKSCIVKLMGDMIDKAVALQYSGSG